MSSGGGSQTVRNVTDIDPVTQQWRTDLMNSGRGLYQQGFPEYYPGQSVVPFSDQTMQGLDMMTQQAQAGAPNLQAANDALGRSFQTNPVMPMAMQTAQGGMPQNQYAQRLTGYGAADNPALRGVFDQGAQQIGDAVNARFAQAGRFGGNAAHTGAMTREIGNLWDRVYMPAYEAERNRGLQADMAMAQTGESALNRQLAGQELAGSLWSQGNTDAARSASMLPGLYDYGMSPARTLMGAGGAWEGLAGEYLADDMARYNYPYQGAWDHLNRYSSLTSGLPFTTNQATTSPNTSNRALSAMGGAMTGASLGSSIAGGMSSGSSAGPWGAVIGGLLGAGASLWAGG